MQTSRRIALSLVFSILFAVVFGFIAYSGLFELIETGLYGDRFAQYAQNQLDRSARGLDQYLDPIEAALANGVSDEAFTSVFLPSEAAETIENRLELIEEIDAASLDALVNVIVIDREREQLHFSTRNQDILLRQANRIQYVPLEDFDLDLDSGPFASALVDAETGELATSFVPIPGGRSFYLSREIRNEFDVVRGTAVFQFDLLAYNSLLIRDAIIGLNQASRFSETSVLLINEPTDIVVGIISQDFEPGRPYPLGEQEEPEAGFVGFYDDSFFPSLYLLPSWQLEMPAVLEYLVLILVFAVAFFFFLLITGLRSDPMVVLVDRLKRFQIVLLREYLQKKGEIDLKRWSLELESKQSQVRKRLTRGLPGAKKLDPKAVDSLVQKSWDEITGIFTALPGANTAKAYDFDPQKLEETLERVMDRISKEPIVTPQAKAKRSLPRPVPSKKTQSAEVEELEELEDLEELEELDEVASPGSSGEDFTAGMKPVAVEELDEDEELEEMEAVEDQTVSDVEDLEDLEELEELDEVAAPGSNGEDFTAGMKPVAVEEIDEDEELVEMEAVEDQTASDFEDIDVEDLEDLEELEELDEVTAPGTIEEDLNAGMKAVAVEELGEDEDQDGESVPLVEAEEVRGSGGMFGTGYMYFGSTPRIHGDLSEATSAVQWKPWERAFDHGDRQFSIDRAQLQGGKIELFRFAQASDAEQVFTVPDDYKTFHQSPKNSELAEVIQSVVSVDDDFAEESLGSEDLFGDLDIDFDDLAKDRELNEGQETIGERDHMVTRVHDGIFEVLSPSIEDQEERERALYRWLMELSRDNSALFIGVLRRNKDQWELKKSLGLPPRQASNFYLSSLGNEAWEEVQNASVAIVRMRLDTMFKRKDLNVELPYEASLFVNTILDGQETLLVMGTTGQPKGETWVTSMERQAQTGLEYRDMSINV